MENEYVGVSCGKLDQSCEIYAKEGHLLHLDTLNDEYELIPASPKMKPYGIAIFFSGLERSLAGTKFNMRVDECRSAAYAMKAFAGLEYGKFNETVLRQVPYSVFEEFKDRLLSTGEREPSIGIRNRTGLREASGRGRMATWRNMGESSSRADVRP